MRRVQSAYDSLTIVEWSPPEFTLDVVQRWHSHSQPRLRSWGSTGRRGAPSGLTRTASGSFTLEKALSLDMLLTDTNWQQHLVAMDAPLSHLPAVHLDEAAYDHITHGRTIPADTAEGTIARAYAPDGTFTAILQRTGAWKPHKVFL
ncbi:MAG: hypothetical protein U0694_25095 [Anaerolineae bacterium]